MSGPEAIGAYVQARTSDGAVHEEGEVIAYTDAPTVIIRTVTGEHVSWRADMIAGAEPSKPKMPPDRWWELPVGEAREAVISEAFLRHHKPPLETVMGMDLSTSPVEVLKFSDRHFLAKHLLDKGWRL